MSDKQVANGVNAAAGYDAVSSTYVWQLRTGKRPNPTWAVLQALAKYFGASPEVFLTDVEREQSNADLRLIAALRGAGALELATNVVGLSESAVEVMIQMARHARQLEGLPAPEPLEGLAAAQPTAAQPLIPRTIATVDRTVSEEGTVFVDGAHRGQLLALGAEYAGAPVTLNIDDEYVRVELPDGARRRFARRESAGYPGSP